MPHQRNPVLRHNPGTRRTPNHLVKDNIAETVKSIRRLYDVKNKNPQSKPGALL